MKKRLRLMNLDALANSLNSAFGEILSIERLPGEIRIDLAGKSAWINEGGGLSGAASRVCGACLEISIDEGSAGISAPRAAIMPRV